MDYLGYLVAAYLIVWLGLFAYLLWMHGILRGLRAEVRELRASVARQEGAVTGAQPATPVELRSH
jgi:CcmD family protein